MTSDVPTTTNPATARALGNVPGIAPENPVPAMESPPLERRDSGALNTQSIVTWDIVERVRRMRFNPYRQLTATYLGEALDMFMWGYQRQAQMLWQEMIARDDTIPGLVQKREKDCSRLPWQVVISENLQQGEEKLAEEQADILRDFWRNAHTVNAYDRNERGGMSRLIRQMMRAVSTRFSVHHIVWQPKGDRLHASFEWVPAYHFENRTGILRFLPDTVGMNGMAMEPHDWMVTVGDGLMISGSIGVYLKREAAQDWASFNEKFGTPGQLWKTSESENSEQGQAMKTAAETFGNDWAGIIYNCPPDQKPLELIEASSATILPFQEMMERIDKKLGILWRGGNLSTSSSKVGNETGASLQDEEKALLLDDDAETMRETMCEVEKTVLMWHYGPDVPVLAGIKLEAPNEKRLRSKLQALQVLVPLGLEVAKSEVRSDFGFATPDKAEDVLRALPAPAPVMDKQDKRPEPPKEPAINEAQRHDLKLLAQAMSDDLKPAREALQRVMDAQTPGEEAAAMADLRARYPEIIDAVLASDAGTEALAAEAAGAMLEELTKEEKNP